MVPLFKIIRPTTSSMAALGSLVGSISIIGDSVYKSIVPVLMAFLVVFLHNAAGYALNDYLDIESDKINHPERSLPSGKIKKETVLIFVWIAFFSSVAISYFINIECFIIAIISALGLLLYELGVKNITFSGNILIGLLTGLTFVFGGFAASKTGLFPVFVLGMLSFLAITAREITKDLADYKGDKYKKTLPKVLGIKRAALVSTALYLTAVSLSPLPFIYGIFGYGYLSIVLVCDLIFAYTVFLQFKNPKKAVLAAKAAMLIALLAFAVGGILS
ncbi:MAG: UbiA family prenyltransferase [Candidatus Micrarchaeota archaeon]